MGGLIDVEDGGGVRTKTYARGYVTDATRPIGTVRHDIVFRLTIGSVSDAHRRTPSLRVETGPTIQYTMSYTHLWKYVFYLYFLTGGFTKMIEGRGD